MKSLPALGMMDQVYVKIWPYYKILEFNQTGLTREDFCNQLVFYPMNLYKLKFLVLSWQKCHITAYVAHPLLFNVLLPLRHPKPVWLF